MGANPFTSTYAKLAGIKVAQVRLLGMSLDRKILFRAKP